MEVNLQAVRDNKKFIDISFPLLGSIHDARIYEMSSLSRFSIGYTL